MATYANQKTFTINRITPAPGSGKQYISIHTQTLAAAARNLSPVGFKLYLYLASNQNGYEKDYSPRDFANIYGVSIDAARKAPQNLMDCGYLILTHGNKYAFFEEPQEIASKTSIALPKCEKRLIPQDDGTEKAMSYMEVYNELKDNYSEEEIKNFWNEQEVWG